MCCGKLCNMPNGDSTQDAALICHTCALKPAFGYGFKENMTAEELNKAEWYCDYCGNPPGFAAKVLAKEALKEAPTPTVPLPTLNSAPSLHKGDRVEFGAAVTPKELHFESPAPTPEEVEDAALTLLSPGLMCFINQMMN
jgi:hypothetical protein